MCKYEKEEVAASIDIREFNATLDWYATTGASIPAAGSKVTPLYCGEQVFQQLELAIKNATRSINLIFWRMDGATKLTVNSLKNIEQLLEEKSKQGVKVKLLLNKLTNLSFWAKYSSGESYQLMRDYELAFPNIETIHRGFGGTDRENMSEVLQQHHIEQWSAHEVALTELASHHQKMALIDCEDPNKAKAFVLGLNLSPEYRDNLHHYYNFNPSAPTINWQDLGCMLEGPIIKPIYYHFLTAWNREKNNTIASIPNINYTPKGHHIPQFCCTQSQEKKYSILESYEKAIGNAHNYIYIENQYFRHIPIAELIKKRAIELQNSIRQHEEKPKEPLYLFVITNYRLEMAFGTSLSTYKMLASLGQQQLMPKIQKNLYEHIDIEGDISVKKEHTALPFISKPSIIKTQEKDQILTEKDKEHISKVEDIKDLSNPDKYDVDSTIESERPFNLIDPDALKVVIGSLYTDSTRVQHRFEKNRSTSLNPVIDYRGIVVHSKLLVVDDIFVSVGSANIHPRGFLTDSEANISIPDHELAHQMRTKLWTAHANKTVDNSEVTSSKIIKCDAAKNFEHWNHIMDENWRKKGKGKPLIAHLTRFWNDEDDRLYILD